jgi:hypothetical protein
VLNTFFDSVISFIVHERGQSWPRANVGVSSGHSQWDEILIKTFEISNDIKLRFEAKEQRIRDFLDE